MGVVYFDWQQLGNISRPPTNCHQIVNQIFQNPCAVDVLRAQQTRSPGVQISHAEVFGVRLVQKRKRP